MTTKEPIRRRLFGARSACLVLLSLFVAAFAATTTAASHPSPSVRVVSTTLTDLQRPSTYGWPMKPFDRQHPVRSFLDDPRIAKHSAAFHFGIDICAPDGTPVYAVEAGTIWFNSPVALAIVSLDRSHEFGYWHIVPAVKNHQHVALHQLIGYVGKGWEHLHFAERRGGAYLNPLRPGGIGPYSDRTAPTVTRITVAGGAIVVDAHDTPSPAAPGAWRGEPVTPARLRWRLAGQLTWHTIADFRRVMLPAGEFHRIYAPQTRQNHRGIAGRFCFYLARGEEAKALASSNRIIQVEASDTAGNTTVVGWMDV